ncbi:fructosamine kinase family protein [Allosphingosinicella sp.]|uniref:fructosamine kinase family protein n=1 Tax=Allosphingosinicella sp. TaxID=2823234 RepID=UPI003783CE92
MTAFAERVAELTGISEDRLERLAGGDLSEVLLVPRADGPPLVAKGGPNVAGEAAMLRALAGVGARVPAVEGEYDGILLIDHVPNDGLLSPNAWADVGAAVARLHAERGEAYGWPVDYALGTVALDNREGQDWVRFWGEQRLLAASSLLDRPWRTRIEALVRRLGDLIPRAPPPALLHGDLWAGNILVEGGRLAAFIDPACYHGHAEVDLAMLCLFSAPPDEFWAAYGERDESWEERLPLYQLFPALVHLRLFGSTYAPLVDRLLIETGA